MQNDNLYLESCDSWSAAIRLLDREIAKETNPECLEWLTQLRHNWVAERRIHKGIEDEYRRK